MSLVAEGVAEAASGGGLIQSFLLIFASEIGDKTFFMAGLLAAKYSRLISLAGSVGALAVMTIISCVIGRVFHAVPSGLTAGLPLDDYAAVAAFAYFGAKTLYDAYQLPDGDSSGLEEEAKEAEEAVNEVTKGERATAIAAIVQTFGLVFAAELGDRSFFTTIALSAALNPFAVALGAIAAHASATGLAVAGGALMSKYLSEKVIGYIGGSLFLVFAVTTALGVF
jgi:putative Ca2+/H+ antiporter (TMEM165/GDT1 family)